MVLRRIYFDDSRTELLKLDMIARLNIVQCNCQAFRVIYIGMEIKTERCIGTIGKSDRYRVAKKVEFCDPDLIL